MAVMFKYSVVCSSRERLLGLLVVFSLICFPMQFPISGGSKVSVSNVSQLLFVFVMLLTYRATILDYVGVFVLVFSMLISGFFALSLQGIDINFAAIIHFGVSLLFLLFMCRLVTTVVVVDRFFVAAIRRALVFLCFAHMALGFYQFSTDGILGVSFFADDKSHAAIFLAFLCILSLIYFPVWGLFISLAFLLLSMMTISRLPYVFAPFILLAMMFRFYLLKFNLIRVFVFPLFVLVGFAIFSVADDFDGLLDGVNRVISAFDSSSDPSDSSIAHYLLILHGFELKFDNIINFMFGVSPSGFGLSLLGSGIDIRQLAAIDPQFVEYAALGRAPIHSTHMAFFVEFPIWIFICYIFFTVFLFYRLIRDRSWLLLLFYCPFLVSVMFYSAHNKPYYFLILALLFSLDERAILQRVGERNLQG